MWPGRRPLKRPGAGRLHMCVSDIKQERGGRKRVPDKKQMTAQQLWCSPLAGVLSGCASLHVGCFKSSSGTPGVAAMRCGRAPGGNCR